MEALKTRFTFTDAGSDKEYVLSLEAKGDGWMVNCHYGRRGGTLALAQKTKEPVAYDVALKAYEKEYAARLKKGYTPDGAAAPTIVTGADGQPAFAGLVPQLLNEMDGTKLDEIITSDAWVLQEKQDGHRRGFAFNGNEVVSANRGGFSVSYPQVVADDMAALSPYFPLTVDGELMGDTYAIFDVRMMEGVSVENRDAAYRLHLMDTLRVALLSSGVSRVFVVGTARTSDEKRALFDRMKAEGREGVVAKRLDSLYVPGKPASGGSQLKFKFLKETTCIVTANHATKRSISIGLLDASGVVVGVGNCTVPANKSVPAVGALVDIKYLYAFPGGSLFQPRLLCERDDIRREECHLGRLHYKAGEVEEGEVADAA